MPRGRAPAPLSALNSQGPSAGQTSFRRSSYGIPSHRGDMPELLSRLHPALAGRYRIEARARRRRDGHGVPGRTTCGTTARSRSRCCAPSSRRSSAPSGSWPRSRLTANLQHPHILPLFDSGEADGFLYYVMPFIEGETLRDRLDREKQLPVDDAVRIAREVADALDYAHRHGVIHRDIKPENVLLHDGRALVADFGIALAAEQGRQPDDRDRDVARHAALHEPRAGDGRARHHRPQPTSTPSAACCTRCSPASRRSPDPPPRRSWRRC